MKTKNTPKNSLVMVKTNTHSPLISTLNQALALTIDLKLQTKQAHWNVKGQNFIAIHELFDQIATDADQYADLLAERVMQLGGMAQGTLQAVTKNSSLPAYPTHIEASEQHISALCAAINTVSEQLRCLIDTATEQNDAVTADICTEVVRGLDKWHWFVVSHLTH
jgi:starvation-inducible DNA-binding protein